MDEKDNVSFELVELNTEEEEKIILLDEELSKNGKNRKIVCPLWKCCPLYLNISTTCCCPCCCLSCYSCCYCVVCIIFLFVLTWFFYGLIATLTFKSPDFHFEFGSGMINTPVILSQVLESFNHTESIDIFTKSLTFRTIDYEEDVSEFDKLFSFLNNSFPLFFSQLKFVKFQIGWMFVWEGNSKHDSILITAHFDVVDAEGQDWIVNPFSGSIIDGYIYGRGTLDDKSSAVSMMNTVEIMLREGYEPTKTFYFCFGLDEETGSEGAMEMSEYLRKEGIKPLIGLDEGGFITSNILTDFGVEEHVAMIGVNEKGYFDLNMSLSCEGGHSSIPPKKGNCIQMVGEGVGKIDSSDYPSHTDSDVLQTFFSSVFSKSSLFYRIFFGMFRKSKLLMNYAFSGSPTSNAMIRTVSSPTIIEGGIANNVLPSYVSVIVNSRTHPLDSISDIVSIMKEKVGVEDMEYNVIGHFKEAVADSCFDCREFDLVQQTIDSVFTNTIKTPYVVLGATDLFQYKSLCSYTYNFSPFLIDGALGDEKREHGRDERISVDGYLNMINFYYAFFRNAELL